LLDGQSNAGLTAELLPAWPCSRWGLPSQTGHPACWWALTSPFHPYRQVSPAAVYFLLHFPWPCGRWALPTIAPCGARTFLRQPT